MKTEKEMQAALNDIRRVCEAHGVVLLPNSSIAGGLEIGLHDVADLIEDPSPIYRTAGYSDGPVERVLKVTNIVAIRHYGPDRDIATTGGIGDIEGHTKPRITVHKHFEGIGEVNVESSVDVTSLDEIESLEFLKEYRTSRFQRFAIGLGDGPFGTLIAEYEGHASMVVGFIEGSKPEELLKKWPAKRGTQDGNL